MSYRVLGDRVRGGRSAGLGPPRWGGHLRAVSSWRVKGCLVRVLAERTSSAVSCVYPLTSYLDLLRPGVSGGRPIHDFNTAVRRYLAVTRS